MNLNSVEQVFQPGAYRKSCALEFLFEVFGWSSWLEFQYFFISLVYFIVKYMHFPITCTQRFNEGYFGRMIVDLGVDQYVE